MSDEQSETPSDTPLESVPCPSCGASVPPGSFCSQCGARLGAAPPPAFTRPDAWRDPLPPSSPSPGDSGAGTLLPGSAAPDAIPPPPPPVPGAYAPPYGAVTGGGTNGFAIASLVLALVWVCGIGSLLAVIFGLIALSQIAKLNQHGRGLALAGLIVGAVGLVGTIGLMVWSAVVADDTANDFNFEFNSSYGDDDELDALWLACGVGDMDACDELYYVSPPGSGYERYGGTCGERVTAPANGDCRERFP